MKASHSFASTAADRPAEFTVSPSRPIDGDRRIGRLLLERMVAELRARRVRRIYLEVEAGNCAAETLYERFGFRRNGRLRDYYGPGKDAVHMVYEAPIVVQAFQPSHRWQAEKPAPQFLSLLHYLRSRALNHRQQLFLLLRRHAQLVQRRLQVADAGVEFRVGDLHPGVRLLHLLSLVARLAARSEGEELGEVLFQLVDVVAVWVPVHRLLVKAEQAAAGDALRSQFMRGSARARVTKSSMIALIPSAPPMR